MIILRDAVDRRQRPLRRQVRDLRPVRTPHRRHLVARRLRELRDLAALDVDDEQVVVAVRVRIGFVVRAEDDLVPLRRPVDRVLVVIAGRELPRFRCLDVDDPDVTAAAIREAGAVLVLDAIDHARLRRSRLAAGIGGEIRERLRIGGPAPARAGMGEVGVAAFDVDEPAKLLLGDVVDAEEMRLSLRSLDADLVPFRRPQEPADAVDVEVDLRRFALVERHEPGRGVRRVRLVVRRGDDARDRLAVRRHRQRADVADVDEILRPAGGLRTASSSLGDEADSVERMTRGGVQRRLVGEDAVGRRLRQRHEAELFSRRRNHVDAARLAVAGRGDDVAVRIDRHAVDAAVLLEVVHHAAAAAFAVGGDVVRQQQMRAVLSRRGVGDVQRLLVRRQDDAVGHLDVGDDARHRVRHRLAVLRVDPVDGVDLLAIFRTSAVARVGEVDPAGLVEAEIVRRGQAFAGVLVGEDGAGAVFLVTDDGPGPVFAAGSDKSPLGVEAHAVGIGRLLVGDLGLAGRGAVDVDPVLRRIGEEDVAVLVRGRALAEREAGGDFFDRRGGEIELAETQDQCEGGMHGGLRGVSFQLAIGRLCGRATVGVCKDVRDRLRFA